MARASASVPAIGFSQDTFLPASMAARATGACMKLGVTMSTKSISGNLTVCSQFVDAWIQPQ